MTEQRWGIGGVAVGILALVLAACSQQQGAVAAPNAQPPEKTFTLQPNTAPVQVAFLAGQLQDLRVSERVEARTGKVLDPPLLHATLKLKNISGDQSARLISGKLQYLDPDGKPIPLSKDRQDTGFALNSYQTDRLDPGMQTSQEIEVPFPVAGLKNNTLRDIRLDLTYTPLPYKEQGITVPFSVSG
jgi:hypothetical protein